MYLSIVCDEKVTTFRVDSSEPLSDCETIVKQCFQCYEKTWKYAWLSNIVCIEHKDADPPTNKLPRPLMLKRWFATRHTVHVFGQQPSVDSDYHVWIDFDKQRTGMKVKHEPNSMLWFDLTAPIACSAEDPQEVLLLQQQFPYIDHTALVRGSSNNSDLSTTVFQMHPFAEVPWVPSGVGLGRGGGDQPPSSERPDGAAGEFAPIDRVQYVGRCLVAVFRQFIRWFLSLLDCTSP